LPISKFIKIGLREYQMQAGLTYPYGWALVYYFKKRGEVPVKGKKGQFENKPVKLKIDGKEREVDLSKVLDEFFKVISEKPPSGAGDPYHPEQAGEYFAKKLDEKLGFSVDLLADDWKAFIAKLEAPSMGAIDKVKRRFSGAEAGFEITMPAGKGWAWKEEDCVGDEAIRLANPDLGVLVKVEVDGNMENDPLESDGNRSGVKDAASAMAGRMYENCTIETDEKFTAAGIESAWQLIYTGTPIKMQTGDQSVPSVEQKVWHIIIGGTTLKRTYQLVFLADKDKFDAVKPSFEQILNSFKMLKDN
jgi:hypothetical protein